MDDRLKKNLIARAIPGVVPVLQAFVNYHFEKKKIRRQQQFELEKAKRRHEALGDLADQGGVGAALSGQNPQGEHPENMGLAFGDEGGDDSMGGMDSAEIYEELRRLKSDTNCGFCEHATQSLLDADPQTARRGLAELKQYERKVEELSERGASEDEVEREIGEIVQGWDVVPSVLNTAAGGGAAAEAI